MNREGLALWRLICWTLWGLISALDAAVFSPISFGLLFFVPIALAGLRLPRQEVMLLAVACAAELLVFGPAGDPFGLEGRAFTLPEELQPPINGLLGLIAFIMAGHLMASIRSQRKRLEQLGEQVDTDPLTTLANRRRLERFLSDCARQDASCSVLVLDLDHFKDINDRYGHDAGDRVLQQMAGRLSQAVRAGDLVARSGGEEFVVVLPSTSQDVARMVAERIVSAVRATPFDIGSQAIEVTTSVGCATGAPGDALVKLADRALYAAKEAGRDRVEIAASVVLA